MKSSALRGLLKAVKGNIAEVVFSQTYKKKTQLGRLQNMYRTVTYVESHLYACKG